jgi:hypothetical protein
MPLTHSFFSSPVCVWGGGGKGGSNCIESINRVKDGPNPHDTDSQMNQNSKLNAFQNEHTYVKYIKELNYTNILQMMVTLEDTVLMHKCPRY